MRANSLLSKSFKEAAVFCNTGQGFSEQLLVVPNAHRPVAYWDGEFFQDVRDNGAHVLLSESCVLEATPTNFNWSFWSLSRERREREEVHIGIGRVSEGIPLEGGRVLEFSPPSSSLDLPKLNYH